MKVKVTAFRQQARSGGFDDISLSDDPSQALRAPTEEEIELELLQRKEAMQEGGAA